MRAKNCDCFWIQYDYRKRKLGMITALFKLYRLFKKLNPDVINTHLFDDSVPALFAARLAKIKTRVILKGDTAYHWYYNPKWVWVDRFNNWNATHIVAPVARRKNLLLKRKKRPI